MFFLVRFTQMYLQMRKCQTITSPAWIQLERRNIQEEKHLHAFCFYFTFLFWKSLYTHLHSLWDHAFLYIHFLTSIFVNYANCGQASGLSWLLRLLTRTLSEQRPSDLCFPTERIQVFGGIQVIDNAKNIPHSKERARKLHISFTMDNFCSKKMQPFYGRWKQDKWCSPGSPTLVPGVISHYISAARNAITIEQCLWSRDSSRCTNMNRDIGESVEINLRVGLF